MDVTKVPECILADETAPAPSGPYATIRPKQAITEHGQAMGGQSGPVSRKLFDGALTCVG